MICPKCGKDNNEGARFCKHCGNNLYSQYGDDQELGRSRRDHAITAGSQRDHTATGGSRRDHTATGGSRRDHTITTGDESLTVDFGYESSYKGSDSLREDTSGGYDAGGRGSGRYDSSGYGTDDYGVPGYRAGGYDRTSGYGPERGGRGPAYSGGEPENRPPKFLYAMIGVISILIIAVSALFVWRTLHPGQAEESADSSNGKISTTAPSDSSDDSDDSSNSDDSNGPTLGADPVAEPTEDMLRSVIGEKEYADTEADDPGMAYTGNQEPQYSLHNNPTDFESVTFDGGKYHFTYAKYLFSKSIYINDENGERYYFYHEGEDGTKQVPSLYVASYDDPGDIMERTRNLYNTYVGWCGNEKEKAFISKKTFVNNENITIADARYHGISLETQSTIQYIIASNDGYKSHIWIYEYPIPEDQSLATYPNYLVDGMYRGCSFGGASKKPRSYQDFYKSMMEEQNKDKDPAQ